MTQLQMEETIYKLTQLGDKMLLNYPYTFNQLDSMRTQLGDIINQMNDMLETRKNKKPNPLKQKVFTMTLADLGEGIEHKYGYVPLLENLKTFAEFLNKAAGIQFCIEEHIQSFYQDFL